VACHSQAFAERPSVIPSMSSAFDSFFGFIFWAVAYYHLNKGNLFTGPRQTFFTVLNIFILLLGLFMLGPGLYTSIDAIIAD
jgi:hypothetical protein